MFSFINSILGKITSLLASAIIAIGLVSTSVQTTSPPQYPEQTQPIATTNLENNANDDVKKEIEELRSKLEQEQQKREALENKINQPSALATASESQITQQKPVAPTTFTTPSGAVLDQLGNVISLPASLQSNSQKVQTQTEVVPKELTTSEIAELILPATVLIKTFTIGETGAGSGFFIESDGLILTAAHVVQGFSIVQATLSNGKTYNGRVLGRDDFYDVALVQINASHLPVVPLGNSDDIKIGEEVLVFGYPLSLSLDISQPVLSKGILNGKQPGNYFVWLQTDAKTQGGSSGGPWI